MLSLRPAEISDWARLHSWRNDPETQRNAKSTGDVALKTHMEWLRETLKSPSVKLFVCYDTSRDVAVGTGRLDMKGATAELSFTVDPSQRAGGYGKSLVSMLVTKASELGMTKVVADVRNENAASLRAFASNQFLPVKYGEAVVRVERPL